MSEQPLHTADNQHPASPPPLTTSLFLPHWWADLCVEAVVSAKTGAEPREFATSTKFLPVFKPAQCKLGAQIFALMQRQLLSTGGDILRVSQHEVHRELHSQGKRNTQQVWQAVQDLWALRVLAGEGSQMKAYPLFRAETWDTDGDLQLCLSPWGSELLCGYREPYADFVRQHRGELHLQSLIAHPPLHLWKSIWLDTQGLEQAIYIRMEEAAQHEGNWLNLEHSVCQDLHHLTAHLVSDEDAMLKHIGGLGKKLTEHGYLSANPAHTALFLHDAQKERMQLVWTLHRLATMKKSATAYLDAVCRYFARCMFSDVFKDFWAILVPDEGQHRKLREEILTLLAQQDFASETSVATMLDTATPLLDIGLFCEWSLRQLLPQLKIPDDFLSAEVLTLLSQRNTLPIAERFAAFRAHLAQHSELVQGLDDAPLACVVSAASVEKMREYLSAPRQEVSVETKVSAPASAVNAQQEKIAALELQKMMSYAPSSYRKLEHDYLASLEPEARGAIVEIKKHMQPRVFADHLRPRLVSFMVENPSAWERTAPVRELGVFD